MEMNEKYNDMDIEAAIVEAKKLLEEIPGVDSMLATWDVYCAHIDGPSVVDPYSDEVANNPNPQDQRMGMQILIDIYSIMAAVSTHQAAIVHSHKMLLPIKHFTDEKSQRVIVIPFREPLNVG